MIEVTIDAGVPFTVGPWEMLVVESTMCVVASIDDHVTATATRTPIALIVRYPDGDRAFDLEGREIPVQRSVA